MDQTVFAYLEGDENKGLKGMALRLTAEKPRGNREWHTNKAGNVFIEKRNGSVIQVLQKLDAKTSPIKNKNLQHEFAKLMVEFTPPPL